ncbi:hypothetical protein [Deinococcus apachensis]|uniref:hypothetical protein n=1 Tax=Deinococcus apachensis TaxID=309886 RepID=UPI0003702834|nr:hypothetical protein [Deinococcus apachensis]
MTSGEIYNLRVDGESGFVLSRIGQTAFLTESTTQVSIPIHNINALTYRRVRYPVFLAVALILFVIGLVATSSPPYTVGDYELAYPALWFIAALVALVLYYVVTTAALVVYSGSFRTILRGSEQAMRQAFELLQ